MAALQEFVPLNTEEDKTLAVRKKAQKVRRQQQKRRIAGAPLGSKSSVVYVGHIPHGFYEEQMRGFFGQFGTIKRLRISRNRKTGKAKHYAFIQFESPEVAEIVADAMNNYLLFEHVLQVKVVPLDRIHSRMWVGSGRVYKPPNFKWLEFFNQKKKNKPEEQQNILKQMLKKDKRRREKIKAAGIDYDYPDLIKLPVASKKIKFSESDDE